jgi:hypothetical protein
LQWHWTFTVCDDRRLHGGFGLHRDFASYGGFTLCNLQQLNGCGQWQEVTPSPFGFRSL